MNAEMQAIVNEISEVIQKVTNWKQDTSAAAVDVTHDARAFVGTADGWRFVVVDFEIESQGFPAGSRGHDGAANHDERGIIYHLTREQAKTALDVALAQLSKEKS